MATLMFFLILPIVTGYATHVYVSSGAQGSLTLQPGEAQNVTYTSPYEYLLLGYNETPQALQTTIFVGNGTIRPGYTSAGNETYEISFDLGKPGPVSLTAEFENNGTVPVTTDYILAPATINLPAIGAVFYASIGLFVAGVIVVVWGALRKQSLPSEESGAQSNGPHTK
jgi:hypothetical protein